MDNSVEKFIKLINFCQRRIYCERNAVIMNRKIAKHRNAFSGSFHFFTNVSSYFVRSGKSRNVREKLTRLRIKLLQTCGFYNIII